MFFLAPRRVVQGARNTAEPLSVFIHNTLPLESTANYSTAPIRRLLGFRLVAYIRKANCAMHCSKSYNTICLAAYIRKAILSSQCIHRASNTLQVSRHMTMIQSAIQFTYPQSNPTLLQVNAIPKPLASTAQSMVHANQTTILLGFSSSRHIQYSSSQCQSECIQYRNSTTFSLSIQLGTRASSMFSYPIRWSSQWGFRIHIIQESNLTEDFAFNTMYRIMHNKLSATSHSTAHTILNANRIQYIFRVKSIHPLNKDTLQVKLFTFNPSQVNSTYGGHI